MVIDYKEIPPAHKGGGHQDRFEQFACDFLETTGFKILRRPDRGADGKKDIIVSETRKGIENETTIKWLVSCKHNAHSGVAVKDTDEPDIIDRVNAHGCDGFMGIYSTIPAASLSNKLAGYKNKIESTIYDSTRIEKLVLSQQQRDRLLLSYFPNSHHKFHQQLLTENTNSLNTNRQLTEDDVLRITKTAIILLEVDKIREEYNEASWVERESILGKLYKFANHSNDKIENAVFLFLNDITYETRHKMPSSIASSIHFLILTFSPSLYDTALKERIENIKLCAYTAFTMTYDAFIYLNNFRIAEHGLLILKFVYRTGIQNGIPELVKEALSQYDHLESTLDRPERKDLKSAKEFIKIFRNDWETREIIAPDIPDHLFDLVRKG